MSGEKLDFNRVSPSTDAQSHDLTVNVRFFLCAFVVRLGLRSSSLVQCTNGRLWWANGCCRPPARSDIDSFGDAERVFECDAKVSHGAVNFGVPDEELHRAKVAGLPVD